MRIWSKIRWSAVGYKLDDRGVGVLVPVTSRIFASPYRLGRPWVPPNSLSNGTRKGATSLRIKRQGREANNSLPARADVKGTRIYRSTPQCAFMAEYGDSFTWKFHATNIDRPLYAEPHPSLTTSHPETDCTLGWRKEAIVCSTRQSFQKWSYLILGCIQYLSLTVILFKKWWKKHCSSLHSRHLSKICGSRRDGSQHFKQRKIVYKPLTKKLKLNSMVWVLERTVPTERPPLVGEVITNFCR
jgi:hypothetical protein